MKINLTILISVFSIAIFISCNSETKNSKLDTKTEIEIPESYKWNSELKSFKYSNLKSIDFSPNGLLIQKVENLSKVDSVFKNKNFEHFLDKSWANVTQIYKYGTIAINDKEQLVYLSIRDHDGYSYNYHLVDIDDKGDVRKAWIIAYSWTAAECIGYDRIYIKSDSMISETLEKCFDEEAEGNHSVDSIRDVAPLSIFQFD